MKRMIRSYKQNLSKLIQNLYKLKSQSLSKKKNIPQDLIIAISRLEDYMKVLEYLRENNLRVKKGGEIVPIQNISLDLQPLEKPDPDQISMFEQK